MRTEEDVSSLKGTEDRWRWRHTQDNGKAHSNIDDATGQAHTLEDTEPDEEPGEDVPASEIADKQVLDAGIIAAAQAVEHYEITRYGSLVAWAKMLGRNDCAAVLQQTLDEEKNADKNLTSLAESGVNRKAA